MNGTEVTNETTEGDGTAHVRSVHLLLPGETLPGWAAAAVERMVAETDATVTHLVISEAEHDRSVVDSLRRVKKLREWAPVAAAHSVLDEDRSGGSVHVDEIPALAGATRTYCEPVPRESFGNDLPEFAVEELREADIAIRFGFGILLGDALSAPTHGVLSYHHGDLTKYRGQPMGFWEYVRGEDTAGVTVQRLNETLDGGEIVVLEQVAIDDADTWPEVRRRLFERSEGMLAQAVRNVEDPSVSPLEPDELGDLYTLPKGRPVATYLLKTARGLVRRQLRALRTGRRRSPVKN
ncbi:formyltransferase family protein [Halobium salinum]|uniref:Formyltransferase family protein n=1 Tax=Halobium salinum TaxID=1364940 RepID=A0ABD5PCR0_9EURY|nr:formyltransferase family protein [Halobium salinum]